MASLDLIQNSWSDIIFEGRNKEYGAYVLRRQTGKRNFMSIIAVLVLFALCMVFLVAKNAYDEYRKAHMVMDQVTELSALTQKKEAKVERKEIIRHEEVKKEVEQVKSSIKFTAPVIKKDDEVQPEDEMKTQDEIMNSNVAVGALNVEGNDESGELLKLGEAIKEEPKAPPVEENKVFDVVEQMPSFPGGTAALMQYLSSHIKYPPIAEENGIQGRVICTFVVGKDGSISNVNVVKSVDPSLDKEAVRVVKSMPNWIPGKQNGSAVNVKYTLPVTFRLQ